MPELVSLDEKVHFDSKIGIVRRVALFTTATASIFDEIAFAFPLPLMLYSLEQ